MPHRSKSQQRAMHALAARGEISQDKVQEWDEATKRKKGGFKALPEKVGKKRRLRKPKGFHGYRTVLKGQ